MRQVLIVMPCLAAVMSPMAFAGPELKGTSKGGVEMVKPPAIISEAAATPVRDQRRLSGHILRCWQNGRLLYETGGFQPGSERMASGISVPRAGENDPLVILDLKQGMCILSSH